MRKFQLRQILDIVKTIREAQAFGIYDECRSGALSLAAFIDVAEGTGTRTVALLSGYCELLSEKTVELRHLNSQLDIITDSVKNELNPNKIEVVFFPYKLSMWDSLESIYIAAENDPLCDTYCVPIPYYDRLPGGALGKMHYEGDSYPDYVKITAWREYNLNERRPDIAYIHNPYDDRNLVTSVHPNYYSAGLKKYVEQLIYIPYYVPLYPEKGPETGVVSAFAQCAADTIIAINSRDKNAYSKIRPSAEVAIFGSPKVDRYLMRFANKPQIPCAWKDYAENSAGKKVILVNSTLGALLNGNSAYLEMYFNLFKFELTRDDVFVIWRPHPLMTATLTSMRPALYDAYKTLETEIKSLGKGIIDETPDASVAVTLADAYVGDEISSIAPLFALSGKPIFSLSQPPYKESAERNQSTLYYCSTPHFSASEFLNSIISRKIPPYDAAQAAHYKRLFQNADGTCGEKAHQYFTARAMSAY